MAKGKAPKSWAEQIADLNDPAPRGTFTQSNLASSTYIIPDLDPEEHGEYFDNEDDSDWTGSEDEAATAREHYIDVGYASKRSRLWG